MITAHFVGIDWEEIRNIGASESGMFLDVDGLDTEAYLDLFEVPANTYNVKVQTAFDAYSTQLMLSTVVPTQEPIYLTVQRNSDIGDAGPWMFLDDGFLGEDFATRDDADLLIADRLWLLDKDVSVPMTEGLSFLDVDRFGIGPYRMELLVDLKTESRQGVAFLDADFTEDAFLVEEDSTDIDRAIRAIRAAKSLRDKAGVRFDPLRPLIPSDKVTETTQTSDWFPNSL